MDKNGYMPPKALMHRKLIKGQEAENTNNFFQLSDINMSPYEGHVPPYTALYIKRTNCR